MIISLDPRTFLISTSLTMAIFAVVLLSMRRSMAQTVHGLETFALANLFGTAASLLLGFRGSIPFFLSFWVGNYLLLMGGVLYIIAVRRFDDKPIPRHLIPLSGAALAIGVSLTFWLGDAAAKISASTGLLGSMSLYCAWMLATHRPAGFHRFFCAAGFFGLGSACLARAITTQFEPAADLFARSNGSFSLYFGTAVMEFTMTIGFIMMINERIQQRLLYLATHDPLTGARTRGSFMEIAERTIAEASSENKCVSIMIADLDKFKNINDTFGHQAGDQALRNFVKAANAALRENDVLARYGGEEFVVLLPNTAGHAALDIAERLRANVERSATPNGFGESIVTVSIGVSSTASGLLDIETLIAHADQALYASKNNGRNKVTMSAAPPALTPDKLAPSVLSLN